MNEDMKRIPDWKYTYFNRKKVEKIICEGLARQKQIEQNKEISKMVKNIQAGIK